MKNRTVCVLYRGPRRKARKSNGPALGILGVLCLGSNIVIVGWHFTFAGYLNPSRNRHLLFHARYPNHG